MTASPPTAHANCNSTLSSVILISRSELPMTPSYMLEWHTEVSKTFYLLDYQVFLQKEITQEQPDRRDAQGEEWRKGLELPGHLQAAILPFLSAWSPTRKLSESGPFGVFMEAHYVVTVD